MVASLIQNGDIFALRGGSALESEVIEAVTDGDYCHVGVFFLKDGVPWIAEMYNDYREISLADRIAEGSTTTMCWCKAPEIIRSQPGAVTSAMYRFRADTKDHIYDYLTLLRVWASDKLGASFDSDKVGVVCSVYVQRIWGDVLQGFFTRLWSPNDIVKLCQEVQVLWTPTTATT